MQNRKVTCDYALSSYIFNPFYSSNGMRKNPQIKPLSQYIGVAGVL